MTNTGRTPNLTPATGVVLVDGQAVGTLTSIDWGAGDDFTAIECRARGLNPGHFILDELPLSQQFGRILRNPTARVLDYDGRQVNHQMLEYASGWIWSTWRARNLSHRHTAGARKRKAALKQAARTRRVAIASF